MAGHILLLFYGLCAWGAALNLPAWIRLAVRAWRAPDRRPPWKNDTHMLVRFGIMALAFGTSGLAGLRTIASLTGRVPLEVPSKAGLLFIGAMALAEPFFLRVDEVHARARGTHSLAWRLYWAGAAIWCAMICTAWICG
jgi:hypothetical protein